MSYNYSRLLGKRFEVFNDLKSYILDGSEGKPISQIRIYLEIISRVKITTGTKKFLADKIKNSIYSGTEVGDYLEHDPHRVGEVGPIGFKTDLTIRFITIHSYYFHILIFPSYANDDEIKSDIHTFEKLSKRAERLIPDKKSITVKVSKRNTLDVWSEHHLKQYQQYDDYYKDKNKGISTK